MGLIFCILLLQDLEEYFGCPVDIIRLRDQMNSFLKDRIKKELGNLEKKTKVIKNLEKKRKDAFFLLDNMTKMVVENTSNSRSDTLSDNDNKHGKRLWFIDFQAKGDNIDIKGIAMDNKTVADFMTRLENSKLYKNVNLKRLEQKKIRKLNLKSFAITCSKIPLNQSKSQK